MISSTNSPFFTFTGIDVQNAFFNSLKSLACPAAAFSVALTVNKTCHAVFGIKQGSDESLLIKGTAFLAGAATYFYVQPKVTLVSFTGKKVIEFMVVDLAIAVALKIIGLGGSTGFAGGAFTGWLGTNHWFIKLGNISGTMIGAGVGAAI